MDLKVLHILSGDLWGGGGSANGAADKGSKRK